MILIPDIHINAKRGDKILQTLEGIFDMHHDHDVMFLGDYVYMFSYDRAYLLRLFDLFVKLYKQGRNVTVIAGNHDRISGHFVFQEGQQAFDIIEKLSLNAAGTLRFVTQPYCRVDGDTFCIVLPYNDHLVSPEPGPYYDPSALQHSKHRDIIECCTVLANSTKIGERLSALLNTILLTYYETNKSRYQKIVCYHHYYTAHASFPGVKGTFGFDDGAICPECINLPGLYLISGHIHEPFSHQNYLCCGSMWHTSGGEQNECKYYAVGDPDKGFAMHMTHINPRVRVDVVDDIPNGLDERYIQQYLDTLVSQSAQRMHGPLVSQVHAVPIPLANTELVMRIPKGTHIATVLPQDLQEKMYACKYVTAFDNVSTDDFTAGSAQYLGVSINDWKTLLYEYIEHKYPDSQQVYKDFLIINNIV